MGIRNNLLGVGSAGITTKTGIIVGAATIEIVLVVHRITWRPDRRPAIPLSLLFSFSLFPIFLYVIVVVVFCF